MAEGISIPSGAFAAAKAGAPAPMGAVANAVARETPTPATPTKTINRKLEAPKEMKAPEPSKPVEEMTPTERKIWKLKADGEEFDFDATDEDAVKREIMKARGADKRFKESAAYRQQAETFFQMLKDPNKLKDVLADPRVGLDVKKFAKDLVWEEIQESMLTDEQKAQRARDKEYEQLKSEKERDKATKEEAAKQERTAKQERFYEQTILKALEIKGVPKDQFTVMKMADHMIAAVQQGYDISPEQVAELVKSDTADYLKAYASALNEDQFLEFLGDMNAEKLRKADLKKLRSPTGKPFPERYLKPEKKSTPQASRQSSSDWRKSTIKDFLARK